MNVTKTRNTVSIGKFIIISLVAGQLLFTSGCGLLMLGTKSVDNNKDLGIGIAWFMGSLAEEIKETPQQVEKATLLAFENLNYSAISSTADDFNAKITGKTTKNESIKVTAVLLDREQTEVTIKIGTSGNKAISMKLLKEINQQLK